MKGRPAAGVLGIQVRIASQQSKGRVQVPKLRSDVQPRPALIIRVVRIRARRHERLRCGNVFERRGAQERGVPVGRATRDGDRTVNASEISNYCCTP
jgi:hypothetical protein